MKKLKNTSLDLVLFSIYHLLVVAGTSFFLFLITFDINFSDFDKIKKTLLNITSISTTAQAVTEKTKPLIKNIRGNVLISESNTTSRVALGGEELKPGTTIETMDKSGALLVFGDKYTCTMRIGSKSKIKIDDLLKLDSLSGTEFSFINLIKGFVTIWVKNSNQKVQISIKSKHASFGVRGTKFSIISDGSLYSLLIVKEGKVSADIFSSSQKKLVSTGANDFIRNNSKDIESMNPEIINLIDWDLNNLDARPPSFDDIILQLGLSKDENNEEAVTATTSPEGDLNLKEAINKEKEIFKRYTQDLRDYLSNDNQYLAELLAILQKDRPKVESDISCLSTFKPNCPLLLENLLISRGFPRTFGTRKYIEMMITDLRAYLQEQEDKVTETKKGISVLEVLIAKREEVFKEVEIQFASDLNLNTIIPRLKDPELVRK